jgi:hypothetical protein
MRLRDKIANGIVIFGISGMILFNFVLLNKILNLEKFNNKGIEVLGDVIEEYNQNIKTLENVIVDLNTVLKKDKETQDIQNNFVDKRLEELNSEIVKQIQQSQADIDNLKIELNAKIQNQPQELEKEKFKLEQRLRMSTIKIENTKGWSGSGETIKYNGKFYILSAGHLVSTMKDQLYLVESGFIISKLNIVKVNHEQDLALFSVADENLSPRFYVEISDKYSAPGESIYVVGNPAGIERVFSEGRVVKYIPGYMLFLNHSWFGSSGGGIYNKQGGLVGIISFLATADNNPYGIVNNPNPIFVINGAVDLFQIQEFMKDVK